MASSLPCAARCLPSAQVSGSLVAVIPRQWGQAGQEWPGFWLLPPQPAPSCWDASLCQGKLSNAAQPAVSARPGSDCFLVPRVYSSKNMAFFTFWILPYMICKAFRDSCLNGRGLVCVIWCILNWEVNLFQSAPGILWSSVRHVSMMDVSTRNWLVYLLNSDG